MVRPDAVRRVKSYSATSGYVYQYCFYEVNRITQTRGERLHYGAETIGYRLKNVGLVTCRLGKAGKGLVMDLATMTRVHELAAAYGGAGLEQDENNLHFPLCTENK
jgi:hypothetical protein